MDGTLPRRARQALGVAAALLVLAGLLSFAPQDPTLTNLRYPALGIANWLGYPGALLGGSLVEGFGAAALLLPLLIANWALNPRRPSTPAYLGYGLSTLLLLSAALGLHAQGPGLGWQPNSWQLSAWVPSSGLPTFWLPGGLSAGLVGWSAGRWLLATAGGQASAWLLAGALAYALLRLAETPRFTELLAAAGLALRRLGWRGVTRAVSHGAWAGAQAGWRRRGVLTQAPRTLLQVLRTLLLVLRTLLLVLRTELGGAAALAAGLGALCAVGAAALVRAADMLAARASAIPLPRIGVALAVRGWLTRRRLGALRRGTPAAGRMHGTAAPAARDGGAHGFSPAQRGLAPSERGFSGAERRLSPSERIARWEQLLRRYSAPDAGPSDAAHSTPMRTLPPDAPAGSPWSRPERAADGRSGERRKPH